MIVPIFDNLQMNIISKLKLTRIKVVKKVRKNKAKFQKGRKRSQKIINEVCIFLKFLTISILLLPWPLICA